MVIRTALGLTLLISLSGHAYGGEMHAEKIAMLSVYAAIDYDQSAEMLYRRGYEELNPLLGPNASRRSLLAFGMFGLAIAYAGVRLLPEPWGTVLIDSALASEQFNIQDNERVLDGRSRRITAIPIVISVQF